ncbi:hypothetical protein OPT61_g414 [Boeremia exigua]|uniref:Uncharacterized protein n=1 Tax=Boeremia exigua TaxID=749465 RepID=A0ACC2ITW9_9PLEO|nr:hypothetical protein OPT61_g414 [Boeremia exigua]
MLNLRLDSAKNHICVMKFEVKVIFDPQGTRAELEVNFKLGSAAYKQILVEWTGPDVKAAEHSSSKRH